MKGTKTWKPKKLRPKTKGARKSKGLTISQAIAVKRIAKSQMNRVIETKRGDYIYEPAPADCCYHNVWKALDTNALFVSQGVGDSETLGAPNRIGDAVYARNLNMRCLFTSFADRPNMYLRILILRVKSGTTVNNPTAHPQLNNNLINIVNTENANIVGIDYDETFSIQQNVNIPNALGYIQRDVKFFWKYNLRISKKIKYQEGSGDPQNWTYRVFALYYDTQAALQTDNVARFSYGRQFYFQDA